MGSGRDLQSSLAWIGGGLAIGLMAFLGLNTGAPVPGKSESPPRQAASNSTFTSIEGTLSLPASMWDDPFERVQDPELLKLSTDSDVKALIEEKLGGDGRIMYLLVPVQSGSTADSLESRRRKRHAVELATANQGFSLSFPDRMTFRRVEVDYHFAARDAELLTPAPPAPAPLPKDGDADLGLGNLGLGNLGLGNLGLGNLGLGKLGLGNETAKAKAVTAVTIDLYLPTKLYKHKDSNDYILVTWVQEEQLGKQPLAMVREIIQPVLVDEAIKRKSAAFCILGPTYSDCLRDFVRDGKLIKKSDEQLLSFYQGWGLGSTLCNVSCTASDQSLGLVAGQSYMTIGDQQDLRIIHTIGSDDRLLSILAHELTLRGVWMDSGSTGKFVIFAEQSSLSYIEGMQKSLYGGSQDQQPMVIPYLKGIASAGSEVGGTPSPEGSSVRDYLERTMSELLTSDSSRLINPSLVRTVGILGSSWDDKNLILEKARAIFPVATFFTTELDARYNLPEYNSHARNLVVASHYGLGIRGRSTFFGSVDNIPSFRDGYQTSAFIGMSVLGLAFRENRLSQQQFELSLGKYPQDLFDLVGRRQAQLSESYSQAYLQPLAFEIGSQNAIQLPSRASPDYLPLRQPIGVSPIHQHGSLLITLLVTLVGTILIFNFLAAFSTDALGFRDAVGAGLVATGKYLKSFFFGSNADKDSMPRWSILLPALLAGLLLCVMIISDQSLESEPIMFSGGISIWPTLCGLYLVIGLSVREIFSPLPDLSADAETDIRPPQRSLAWKLAFTIAIVFYLTSFLESGIIQPPARDWLVRWLAHALLFGATLCILLVTCKCLLFSLYARKVIECFRSAIPSEANAKTTDPKLQESMVEHCRTTMNLSVEASRRLLWPAALSILFIASRWNWWDSWGQDKSWFALLGTPMAISFVAAIVVRLTAVRYRSDTVEFLRRWHYDHMVNKSSPKSKVEAELLEESTEEITRLDRGPFGPLSRDYLLGAAALLVTILFTGPLGALVNRVFTFLP